jgi:GntR family transcriptional regulator, transcriptional repressor for pyruvate dehydrogenase complex
MATQTPRADQEPKAMPHVERVTLSEQVARAIKSFIVDSRLKPGDKLLTEQELCAYFQVSRVVIREALKSLETAGVVSIQHGKGTYVESFDGRHVAEQLGFGIDDDLLLFEQMMELRFIIEAGAIELAVNKITESQLSGLRHILDGLRLAAEQGSPTEELDFAFHRGLLLASNNAPLGRMVSVLTEFFRLRALCFPPSNEFHTPDEQVREHEMILEALQKRDADSAKRVLREGLLEYRAQAEEWRTRQARDQ